MMPRNKKIKVLEICGGLSTEGIGVFLLNAFENIDKEKFEIHFALATKYKQAFEDRIVTKGGKVFKTYEIGDGIRGKVKHFINLYKIIKKEKYDVVHSHMDFFNGFNLFIVFLAGVPLRISHAHIANNTHLSLVKKIYYSFMKIFIKLFSNKCLGCSVEANKFINGKGKVIYNGINVDKFQKKDYCFPKDIQFNKDYKNLITVGRIDNQKNPLYIVEIIYFLSKIRKDFHFYWIGTGSLYSEVKKKINELKINDKITLLGARNDVEVFLSQMDVFILPSKYEGFGIVLAEAQVAGLKCFISDKVPLNANLGLCEVISLNDGASTWAKKINSCLDDEKTMLSIQELNKIDIRNTTLSLQNEYLNLK